MKSLRPIVKIHGGKYYLNKWIIENFPKDYQLMEYIEPFVGGGSVLLNKLPPLKDNKEIVGDIDFGIISIFRTLRSDPKNFIKNIKKIDYKEENFEKHKIGIDEESNHLKRSIAEFVVRRMSRGGMKESFAWSERERNGIPGDVNAWNTIISNLNTISKRIKDIHAVNSDAINLINNCNGENAFLYCDPPYVPETRTSKKVYQYEMTKEEHVDLLKAIDKFEGKVMISGYDSKIYKDYLKNWNLKTKEIANHSGQNDKKSRRKEVIWFNYDI